MNVMLKIKFVKKWEFFGEILGGHTNNSITKFEYKENTVHGVRARNTGRIFYLLTLR